MYYKLRNDLSKTAVYRAICDHNTSGVELPPIRQCRFQKRRGKYWLSFDGSDSRYEVSFCQWGGYVRFWFDCGEWSECDCRFHFTSSSKICIPFDYCLQNNLLREVA